jgi:TATA-box binding protein (TBP) (component of TFIID and TFIIIB)
MTTRLSYDLVNVVGGGRLNTRVKLENLYYDLEEFNPVYEPEQAGGLYFTLRSSGVTAMIFSKGGYHLTGGSSLRNLHMGNDELLKIINNQTSLDVEHNDPEIRNLVFSGNIGRELDLNALSEDTLGKTSTDASPPTRLYYKIDNIQGTFVLFSTGSFNYMGVSSEENAKRGLNTFERHINSILINE